MNLIPLLILLAITAYIAFAFWVSMKVEETTYNGGLSLLTLILLLIVPLGLAIGATT